MSFFARLFGRRAPAPPPVVSSVEPLRLACRADLWCRKRTSVSTMLDPELFERYTTGDDRIDEDWIVQTNPPSAFRAEFKQGCDALLTLLQEDPRLHATKGFLVFTPRTPPDAATRARWEGLLRAIVATAEREMRFTA